MAEDATGDDSVIGYIDVPWAYDANGNTVPITQTITRDSITLTVHHMNAAYPIYADPTYYNIHCNNGYSISWSASTYLRNNGSCPRINFYDYAEFWPVGSTSGMGVHRNVEQDGQCNVIADSVYGVYDFHIACRAHDYCYELLRQGYHYVSKTSCDTLFYEDLRISCKHKWNDFWERLHREVCYTWADLVYEAVA
ncbi:phospholipase A2 [Candidatus Poriferisocius sp.]|uniref:phospholipase A2 n=1 Tax=Candidatus Poriferisocius sp. TaxID=3101276 RepID=UPI003B01B204